MSDVQTGRASPTEAEIVALNADLAVRMRARVPVAGARKPLGLRPASDDLAEARPPAGSLAFASSVPSIAASFGAETLARPATMLDVAEGVDAAVAIALDGEGWLKARIAELRGENARLTTELARLRAQFAEAKAEFAEAKHILERLQITREGKRGERGPCGADGAPGPRGERGERGERGQAAPAVVEWRPDPEAFTVRAILGDGSVGPMIALRSLFESYHSAVEWLEDADIVEAARQSRAANEAAAENVWSR